MRHQSRSLIAVAFLIAAGAVLTGCTPEPPTRAEAKFALTTVDAAISPGDTFPANFIFVAEEEDPIWDSVTGVALGDGETFGPGAFEVVRSESSAGGVVLGNITLHIPVPADGVAFDQIELLLAGETSVVARVGSWEVELQDSETVIQPSGEFVLTYPRCEPVSATFVNVADSDLLDIAVDIPAAGVDVDFAPVASATAGAPFDLEFDLHCDDTADFWVLSPTVSFDLDGAPREVRTDPVAIGLTAIDETTIDRIRARP
ncbi:hypothetical protein ARHIZOSPH14_26880 [Agromyces rhizosphaerae]|uniref:Lipoprotein n=1 Tax=Agromyces rhizosphaerae TaxID=88374 RepID=A0A9W6CYQ3_9MICO|nr:hypothetical protein [Agromyces rhizosphaerae]GLI28446.1 hypothetical protein ARHIZOSPH14_26880 [Agromyces rhizosphaerae]